MGAIRAFTRSQVLPRSVGMRFFLIDRITRWEVGTAAEATKNVALSEDFFDDHFPRRPVMPGVLLLEGMAQLSGLLLEASLLQKYRKNAKAVLTVLERTKFRALVKPGDTLLYRTEMTSLNEAGGKVKASAHRGDALVTTTEMVFAFKLVDDPLLDEKRSRLLATWLAPDAQTPGPAEREQLNTPACDEHP
jgi:3-hydroxyacyl-[acyl-carrier-protein] dehydratase